MLEDSDRIKNTKLKDYPKDCKSSGALIICHVLDCLLSTESVNATTSFLEAVMRRTGRHSNFLDCYFWVSVFCQADGRIISGLRQ